MLKISLVDSPNERQLVLEGKLVAPWTVELRKACEHAKENLNEQRTSHRPRALNRHQL